MVSVFDYTANPWTEKNGTRVKSASFHANCRRWNKEAEQVGKRATVFPSICDPFEDWQGRIKNAQGRGLWWTTSVFRLMEPDDDSPGWAYSHKPVTMDDLRRELFATIDACQWLDFILLTKRPENVRRMWPIKVERQAEFGTATHKDEYRGNVWLLTSVSDQATADAFYPHIANCSDLVDVLGFSAEPLTGPIRMTDGQWRNLNWVIVGGESGHGARPYDVAWARSIIGQCKEAGVLCSTSRSASTSTKSVKAGS